MTPARNGKYEFFVTRSTHRSTCTARKSPFMSTWRRRLSRSYPSEGGSLPVERAGRRRRKGERGSSFGEGLLQDVRIPPWAACRARRSRPATGRGRHPYGCRYEGTSALRLLGGACLPCVCRRATPARSTQATMSLALFGVGFLRIPVWSFPGFHPALRTVGPSSFAEATEDKSA